MFGLTKLALKRPVTVILALVTILYFGLQAVFNAKIEMLPEMNFPMLVVSTTYIGASATDVDKLISKEIEENASTLSNVKTIQSTSMENASLLLIQYQYGTNMDKAYMDLKKKLDGMRSSLPKDINEPNIIQIDVNAGADMNLTVSKEGDENAYGFIAKSIVPELEKNSTVSSVSISGGQADYIKIEVLQDKLEQYKLNLQTLSGLITASNFNIPAGNLEYGRQELSIGVSSDNKDIERIKNIVIPLAGGEVIKLSDVANVYQALEKKSSLSRYNGDDVIGLAITRQQSSSAVQLSRQIKATISRLEAENQGVKIDIISDNADDILAAIKSVFETLLLAVVLSMIVLFVFFGDIKASLIVGSSIPVSVMLALTMMGAAGYSLNMISLGSLVLGVGMIVDASIVVLDSCFKEKQEKSFFEAALEGTRVVIASIVGSTITTCVVFVPLALLKGLTGQMFTQLGWTIVFCMLASLFSAVTIVPLLFMFTHPKEKEHTISHKIVGWMQGVYKKAVSNIIPRRALVIITSVFLLVLSFVMAFNVGVELAPETDNGTISINMAVAPGLKIDDVDNLAKKVEEIIKAEPDVEKYSMRYGASSSIYDTSTGVSLTAYLYKKRKMSTAQVVDKWREEFAKISDTSITVKKLNNSGMSNGSEADVTIPLQSTDYDLVKKTADEFVKKLQNETYLSKVHSNAENAAPLINIDVDALKAQSYGITPASVGSTVSTLLKGSEVMRYTKDKREIVVKMEFPDDKYKNVSDIESILLDSPTGAKVAIGDIAKISFKDSAAAINRVDKQYQVSITADAAPGYKDMAQVRARKLLDEEGLPTGLERMDNRVDETMKEEMGNLLNALLTAVFLVFIVMAMQFESPRFSLMVMFTIPFALIGAFGLLFMFDVKISMNSMLGFLMMVGTVVNNGILYVDTVNMLRMRLPLREALIEAGALRLRPILMTTLTTVLSMFPMALAFGENGEALQGLALVNVGGLLASTLLSLLLIPTLYEMLDKKSRKLVGETDIDVD